MNILLVSHEGVASGMKSAVQMVMGDLAKQIEILELTAEQGIVAFSKDLEELLLSWLKEGHIGLVFADLKGGTPYNQAELLLTKHGLKHRAKVICGLNLPMVLDVLLREVDINSSEVLAQLVQTARDGISCMDIENERNGEEDE